MYTLHTENLVLFADKIVLNSLVEVYVKYQINIVLELCHYAQLFKQLAPFFSLC